MISCTFFGHRDCPETVKPQLYRIIEDLIEHHGVTMFYVGHQGQFDRLVISVLRDLSIVYPEIDFGIVLSRFPTKGNYEEYNEAILPEGIENVHPRYAITWRNHWMIENSDYVVSYISHSWGGAAKFTEKAKRKNKHVIMLEV